jgi:hypothetical protein
MSISDTGPEQREIKDWEPSGSVQGEYISDIIRMPGFWEADDSCEHLKPVAFCESGHIQLRGAEPCNTRKCPFHWGNWRKEAAKSVIARLAAYRYAQGGPFDPGRRLLHLVDSPPQDQRWTLERFWQNRSNYEPVQQMGARGAVTIPHTYGTSELGDEIFEAAVSQGYWEPEDGKWKLLRESSEDWEQMKELVEVRPHNHHLAAAEEFDSEKAEDGRVSKNIRSLAPFYIDGEEVPAEARVDENGRIHPEEEVVRRGYEDMARLVMYLLSHSAVQLGEGDLTARQTVTYWGEVHPNSFDPEEELMAEEWNTIQKNAAAAVGAEWEPEQKEEDLTGVPDSCSVDGCEEPVHGLHELDDFLARPEWIEDLDYEQACEVYGLHIFLDDGLSPGGQMNHLPRPPPGGFERNANAPKDVLTDGAAFREWLRRLGRSRIHRNPWYQVEKPEGAAE